MRVASGLLLLLGSACSAFASDLAVPEIDGGTAVGAVTLAAGSIMILRNRLRK